MTERYPSILARFMAFKNDTEQVDTATFTQDDLLQITPDDICRWMNIRAYGDPSPRDEMKPIHARSSTLEFDKKAISSFMPRLKAVWDPISKHGNPTRSDEVNKLIKKVKKHEVRREGVKPSARRPIEFNEFTSMLALVRSNQERGAAKYLIGSVLTLQWHLIARIDDLMKLKFADFASNVEFPSTLICQMRWSKNITEERDAPEQIVFGSMDPRVCPLLNLALYIATSINVANSEFVYGNPSDGDRVVRRFLQDVFSNSAFDKFKGGNLGTHSFRKGAATYGTRSGLSKDYVNRRGRWRVRKAAVDIYIDNRQPYPDACAASTLTGPLGPCFYVLKAGLGCVTPTFLLNIAPSIVHVMGESIAKTLALPLLWAALVPSGEFDYELLPAQLKQRIVQAYVHTGGNPLLNPVDRKGIHVAGDGSGLQLIVVENMADRNDTSVNRRPSTGPNDNQRQFSALHSQFFALKRQIADLTNEVLRSKREQQRELQKILAVIKRNEMLPVARLSRPQPPAEQQDRDVPVRQAVARLSKGPKDLFELWHEYQFGSGGRKPARDFTPSERGANKFAYSRRKVFWDVVSELVRSGYTSDAAIDKVYAVFGRQLSVSNILVALRMHKKTGGHPALCV